MSSPIIKTEFTEVLTSSELLPPRPISISSSDEFPTIITESSLLESTRTPNQTIEPKNLVDRYDETFPSPSIYRTFTDTKLAQWKDTLEYKYFDSLYIYHRNTSQTIKNLRRQAMALLNEADALNRQYIPQRQNLDHFISSLPGSQFQRRLFNPVKTYPRPRIPLMREEHRPTPSSSNIRPLRPPYPPIPKPSRQIRCFQCDSPLHIKWYCNEYRCRACKKIAPGHSLRDCPNNQPELYDDGIRGHYDIAGEEDGNLDGEC